jgi:hypothetical protein
MRLKIELDGETTERLVRQAVIERRPVDWQAEIMLRRACGLPDPPRLPPEPEKSERGKNHA